MRKDSKYQTLNRISTDYVPAASTLEGIAKVSLAWGIIVMVIASIAALYLLSEEVYLTAVLLLVGGLSSLLIFSVLIPPPLLAFASITNETHRTAELLTLMATELIPEEEPAPAPKTEAPRADPQEPATEPTATPPKKAIPVRVYPTKDGIIACPACGENQPGKNRYACVSCGQTFINGQPFIPYWCASCGKEGPYETSCPHCGGSAKIYNV